MCTAPYKPNAAIYAPCTPSEANSRCKNGLPIVGTRDEQLIGSEGGVAPENGDPSFHHMVQTVYIWIYMLHTLYVYIYMDCVADGTMGLSLHQHMVHLGLFRGMRPYYKVAAHCAHCVFNHLLAISICLQYANAFILGHNI